MAGRENGRQLPLAVEAVVLPCSCHRFITNPLAQGFVKLNLYIHEHLPAERVCFSFFHRHHPIFRFLPDPHKVSVGDILKHIKAALDGLIEKDAVAAVAVHPPGTPDERFPERRPRVRPIPQMLLDFTLDVRKGHLGPLAERGGG
jgi:hypothetical protein